jgi:hypothetical protein
MKGLLAHGASCAAGSAGGCFLCRRIWALLQMHARQCASDACLVPACGAIRERAGAEAARKRASLALLPEDMLGEVASFLPLGDLPSFLSCSSHTLSCAREGVWAAVALGRFGAFFWDSYNNNLTDTHSIPSREKLRMLVELGEAPAGEEFERCTDSRCMHEYAMIAVGEPPGMPWHAGGGSVVSVTELGLCWNGEGEPPPKDGEISDYTNIFVSFDADRERWPDFRIMEAVGFTPGEMCYEATLAELQLAAASERLGGEGTAAPEDVSGADEAKALEIMGSLRSLLPLAIAEEGELNPDDTGAPLTHKWLPHRMAPGCQTLDVFALDRRTGRMQRLIKGGLVRSEWLPDGGLLRRCPKYMYGGDYWGPVEQLNEAVVGRSRSSSSRCATRSSAPTTASR